MEETKYTYEDLLLALNSMDEEKKHLLLKSVKISDLFEMMNSEGKFENAMKNVDQYVAWYQLIQAYLMNLKEKLESGDFISNKEISKDTILKDYNDLKEDEKKAVVLNLMNNADFQKKCCEILAVDFKRVVNSDATLKAIDNLTGVSRYFDKMVRLGIGCNHKYEVESWKIPMMI